MTIGNLSGATVLCAGGIGPTSAKAAMKRKAPNLAGTVADFAARTIVPAVGGQIVAVPSGVEFRAEERKSRTAVSATAKAQPDAAVATLGVEVIHLENETTSRESKLEGRRVRVRAHRGSETTE